MSHHQLPEADPDERLQEGPHHAFGRAVRVRRGLEEGWSVAAAAAAFEISARTVHKWLARFRSEGAAGPQNRSSAPRLVANELPALWLAMATRLRRDDRMTGQEIAARLHRSRSPVAGHLARLGLGRLAQLELGHLDVKKRARFRRGGHRIPGDRRLGSDGAGWGFVHLAVDAASRLAYVEVLPDEKRPSVTGFLVRALRWFKSQGIRVERGMTDNGAGYVSRLFGKACRILRLRHLRTRPSTPKTNGKAGRFIQPLLRESAYALPYRNSETRAADLPRWLRHSDHERPHASLARQSPTAWLQAQT